MYIGNVLVEVVLHLEPSRHAVSLHVLGFEGVLFSLEERVPGVAIVQ